MGNRLLLYAWFEQQNCESYHLQLRNTCIGLYTAGHQNICVYVTGFQQMQNKFYNKLCSIRALYCLTKHDRKNTFLVQKYNNLYPMHNKIRIPSSCVVIIYLWLCRLLLMPNVCCRLCSLLIGAFVQLFIGFETYIFYGFDIAFGVYDSWPFSTMYRFRKFQIPNSGFETP